MTPLRAIRAKCLDCCCGSAKEVRLCAVEKCPLFPYKMGHRPLRGTDTTEPGQTEKSVENRAVF